MILLDNNSLLRLCCWMIYPMKRVTQQNPSWFTGGPSSRLEKNQRLIHERVTRCVTRC